MRKLDLQPGAQTALHARPQEEVLLLHRGTLTLIVDGNALRLGPGDVMTVPIDRPRRYRNPGNVPCELYIVDGGESPHGVRLAS